MQLDTNRKKIKDHGSSCYVEHEKGTASNFSSTSHINEKQKGQVTPKMTSKMSQITTTANNFEEYIENITVWSNTIMVICLLIYMYAQRRTKHALIFG